MTDKIRIMVVDDSVVIRGALVRMLGAESDITVAATAPDGHVALQRLERELFDLILLDMEMPGMDGLQFLRKVRDMRDTTPILVFSSVTTRGAQVTIEALSLGALDYLTKPTGVGRSKTDIDGMRKGLLDKIRTIVGARRGKTPRHPLQEGRQKKSKDEAGAKGIATPAAATPRRLDGPRKRRIDLVVIGSSTGGPAALMQIFEHLPPAFPLPILIVQHMPPVFTAQMARSLEQRCDLEVREAQDMDRVVAGRVLVAPGGLHMYLERSDEGLLRARISDSEPINSCKPSVDPLFASAAEAVGGHALAIMLTGMGADGCEGATTVSSLGGEVWAQDEHTSVVWGMPGELVRRGIAHRVLPLQDIVPAVLERIRPKIGRAKGMAPS